MLKSFFRACLIALLGTPALASGAGNSNVGTAPNAVTYARIHSAASTNATSVQASSTGFVGCFITNSSSATEFFKVYNKASAPTVGTDTPAFTIPVPKNSPLPVPPLPVTLSTGFAYAITANEADSDATAVGAGDVDGYCLYR